MLLNGLRGIGWSAVLVCGAAMMAACGPQRRPGEEDTADEPEVPWLMGVFTAHAVGEDFSGGDYFATVYEFREGGEGVVWDNGPAGRRTPGEPNVKWEAQSPSRVRVEPLGQQDGNPFIIAPGPSCNELRRGRILNTIEPSDAELLDPLYRGELCVTSFPDAIGGQYEFDYCDAPPPPCDEQPD